MLNGTNVIWVDAWNEGGYLSSTNPAGFVAVIRIIFDLTLMAKTDNSCGWS